MPQGILSFVQDSHNFDALWGPAVVDHVTGVFVAAVGWLDVVEAATETRVSREQREGFLQGIAVAPGLLQTESLYGVSGDFRDIARGGSG